MVGLEIDILLRLLVAGILGAIVGIERDVRKKPAGLRTHAMVCLGSCLFTVIALSLGAGGDFSKVMPGIITGIGFLGGGIIFQTKGGEKKGITTAAGIWSVAGIGIAVGLGNYQIAVAAVLAILFILVPLRFVEKKLGLC